MIRPSRPRRRLRLVAAALFGTGSGLFAANACLVDEHCFSDADCERPKICLTERGRCGYECTDDSDCGENLVCADHRCVTRAQVPNQQTDADTPGPPIDCPEDMVNVGDSFCIDRYEASRSDATETDPGTNGTRATSRAGVLPWSVFDNQTARAACRAAGKDLCPPAHWRIACEGSGRTTYGYGNTYEPETCNGIDTFGRSGLHLLPTGSLSRCRSDWGAFDMNGNLWEHVRRGDNRTIRGGAYNCIDSQTLHRCDYVPGDWTPTARGFRCCLIPTEASIDAGEAGGDSLGPDGGEDAAEDAMSTGDANPDGAQDAGEAGCLDEDGGRDAEAQPDADALPEADIGPDVSESDAAELDASEDASLDAPADVSEASAADAAEDTAPDTTGEDSPADAAAGEDSASEAGPDALDSGEEQDGSGEDANPPDCPPDMVPLEASCMDIYEASHADATDTSYGTSDVAASQPGVLPWFPLSADVSTALDTARNACTNAGKRLCELAEWISACEGPSGWDYGYGDEYDPVICNGIDTYCYCDDPECSSLVECPYPLCYYQSSPEGAGPCGSAFHVMPTGSFAQCLNTYGVYDINGNVWELADTDDGQAHYRGGAYNCMNSPELHRCDHDGNWEPSARGFRCCKDP